MAIIPVPGLASVVTTGGTPVVAVGANPAGGFISNPVDAAGPLFVNPVTAASVVAEGTTFAIYPGASWSIIPNQSTPTSVNAVDDGHVFSVVSW